MANKLSFDIAADELEIFLEEANEHLQAMESGILRLEQTSDAATINAIFRAAHTLKALAGTVGHQQMAELTHTMETLFDAMRSTGFSPNQSVIDDLLAAVDALKVLRDEIITLESSHTDVSVLLARLNVALNGGNKPGAAKGAIPTTSTPSLLAGLDLTAEQGVQVEQYRQAGQSLLEIDLRADLSAFAPAARLSQAVMALLEVGDIITQKPTMAGLANGQHDGCLQLLLATSVEVEAVKKLLSDISDLAGFQIQPHQVESAAPAPASPTTNGTAQSSASENIQTGDKTVRISVERLDTLMNLVGELVTNRNRLLRVENSVRSQYSKTGLAGEMSEITSHVSRVVDQLQEEVMHARMLPIASLFEKFPRIVRDVARLAGKQVNLVIEGEATELDRSLIEVIGDPLIHLLRNAVDHGLEAPEARLKAGKSATGTVKLTAAHLEGQIVITVEDDGQGIDPDRVRQAAVKRGLLTEAEATQLDDEAAIDLIFRPNLSTAEQVTKLSGRGVGMDVVRSNVERLSGSVVVESKLGQGTTFRVTLPLTLAIVQAMLVSVRGGVYAIPLASIIESLYLSEVDINTVKGSPAITWRNSVLPLLDLREFFNTTNTIFRPATANGSNGSSNGAKPAVVTVAWGKLRAGLVVDKIIGKQDIVVKSLSSIIGDVPGLSGGAILGDGHIALIIDVPNLINAALRLKKQLA
ncbi:MAG: chemotaxis protein CheA [Anaerolineae bacterium]